MEPHPDLSVIIVSWNVRPLLRECLRSLHDAITRYTFEVFVVDNASHDGSPEMVRTEFPQVVLIANRENVGFGRANNQAWEKCKGRLVLFLNPDTLIPKGSIDEMIRFIDANPHVGMVGPELPDGEGRLRFNWSRLSLRGVGEFLIESIATLLSRRRPPVIFAKPRTVKWLTGACWLVRREVVEQIGAFDENLFMYGEEPDFCFRLRKAGWKICFLRHVHIVHYKGQSTKQVRKMLAWFFKSMAYVIGKNIRSSLQELRYAD